MCVESSSLISTSAAEIASKMSQSHSSYLAGFHHIQQLESLVETLKRNELAQKTTQCTFFDISIDGKEEGRMVFQLFHDIVPRTAANFLALCTGEKGIGQSGKPLHYQGCAIFRVCAQFILQGGDVVSDDGFGSDSIYGGDFEDEGDFELNHDCAGLLSMANDGPGTNGSQFFVTCAPAAHLDGNHVVFGRLVKGMSTLRKVEAVTTDGDDAPVKPVVITRCGVVHRVGQKVRASYKGSQELYPGTIESINADGTYDVLFDDGDRDPAVPSSSLQG
jgi:cyclophilin family peptidyl-prolyl cis-trans isomerase